MTSRESEMCKRSPTFLFWATILRYETLILMFIRAHREKRFSLYVRLRVVSNFGDGDCGAGEIHTRARKFEETRREGSADVEVLEELVHLFFALDHVNYARWVPIHLRDMKSLPTSVRKEFEQEGHWVLSKTNNKFSAIPIDHAHEQENKNVKSAGGAVGLTENPIAFR